VVAVAHPSNDIVIGWTPDGAHLLFASDRGGAMGLWGQAFRDRKPQGSPQLVKPDIGNVTPLGITRSGALYLGVSAINQDVGLASIDLTTGKQLAPPVKPAQRFTGSSSQPTWSPDGKSLAYVSDRGEKSVVVIRSMETGETRELNVPPGLPYFSGLTWAPDGSSFAARGQDLK
jgi:Tol biopolymer transport system component